MKSQKMAFVEDIKNACDLDEVLISNGHKSDQLTLFFSNLFDQVLRILMEQNSQKNETLTDAALNAIHTQLPIDILYFLIVKAFKTITRLACDQPIDEAGSLPDFLEDINSCEEQYLRKVWQTVRDEAAQIEDQRNKNERILERFLHSSSVTSIDMTLVKRLFGLSSKVNYTILEGWRDNDTHWELQQIRGYSNRVNYAETKTNDGVGRYYLIWPSKLPYGAGHPLQVLQQKACVYLENVNGIREMPSAVRTLDSFLFSMPNRMAGSVNVEDHWEMPVSIYLYSLMPEITRRIDVQLERHASNDCDIIFETLDAWCQTGNIAGTASLCHVHRNTVYNRLKQFETATGLDLTIPHDIALVFLYSSFMKRLLHEDSL